MIEICMILLFFFLFLFFQGIVNLKKGTTTGKEISKATERLKRKPFLVNYMEDKEIWLRKHGASVLLKDNMTVGQWYIYKLIMAALFFCIAGFLTAVFMKNGNPLPINIVAGIFGFFLLDFVIRAMDNSSNAEMMADIMEMSRSVLYGKRGGQYIADALRDAVMVVENKRLKTALIRLRSSIDSGMSLDDCLNEFELSFNNGEISAFCTVIKSLQTTGQVDEALRTLENNIERQQDSVNKKRCTILENKTMLYVVFIAMDIIAMILYCIIVKLTEMQIGF